MKISKYLSIFEDEQIVYNALNNGLVKLNPNLFSMFKDGDVSSNIINHYPDEIKELKTGMFLHDDDFDELQYIKFVHTSEKFRRDNLSLTIAPTLNCNFACYYCIQDIAVEKDDNHMTIKTANNILSFIKNTHKKDKLNSLSITWYGGEPLLNFEIIQYLSQEIKEFITDNNIYYHSSIITNGYLLNYDYAKFLSDHNVKIVQITLDGPEEVHNIRRPHKDKSETYNVIIDNIRNVADLFENILIRFNIDKTNIKDLDNLAYEISTEFNEFDNVVFYVSPVVSDTLSDCNFSNTLYSFKEFSKIKYENRVILPKILYPQNLYGGCGATRMNSFVIKPNGALCKCWNEISQKGSEIRSLTESTTNMTRFLKWISYDPTEHKQCSECKTLPICMGGGCPYRVIFPDELNSPIECNEYKYLLKEYIRGWLEIENQSKAL